MKTSKLFFFFILISYSHLFSQTKFGIDIPLYLNKSIVSVPGVFSSVECSGGNSYDIGLGMFVNLSETVKLKGGFHLWNRVFNSTYIGNITINDSEIEGKLEETGLIKYSGLYALVIYEKDVFFFGGGFDISFTNSYKSDLLIRNSNSAIVAELNDNEQSFLTEEFNNQLDLLLNFGIKLKFSDDVVIKPSCQFSVPFIKLFDSNVSVYNPVFDTTGEAAFNIFTFKFGISVEIGI